MNGAVSDTDYLKRVSNNFPFPSQGKDGMGCVNHDKDIEPT